jgi:sulfatase maturation enzyme AslB (radical SAM superfamily)
MKISRFTFIVTDDCNYECKYCPQKKEKKFISVDMMEKAVDFFYPMLANNSAIGFYGGEPLLGFDAIKDAVSYIKKKNALKKSIDFSISTNGSLLDREIYKFLNQNQFDVVLSFDGLAHNISRKKGDFQPMITKIEKIQEYLHIKLETNSVFTPETIGYLSESIQLILDLGVKDMRFALSIIESWNEETLLESENELLKVVDLMISNYKKTGTIPVSNFRNHTSDKGLFACSAGKERMAITPEGKLWGCYLFHDFFKGKEKTNDYSKYFFGDLDYFIDHHRTLYPEMLQNYMDLRMDNFGSEESYCFLCPDIYYCDVCPVYAAYSSGVLGKIPGWICNINKIKKKIKDNFQKRISNA